MKCDMCGAEGKLFKSIIESARLNVCHECSKFGKVTGIVEQAEEIKPQETQEPETMQLIVEDYAEKIMKRSDLKLTQKDFAKKMGEKESIIQKIESGHFEPPIGLAKKMGKFLGIKLIEEHEELHESKKASKDKTFTIGDFIKIKKK